MTALIECRSETLLMVAKQHKPLIYYFPKYKIIIHVTIFDNNDTSQKLKEMPALYICTIELQYIDQNITFLFMEKLVLTYKIFLALLISWCMHFSKRANIAIQNENLLMHYR